MSDKPLSPGRALLAWAILVVLVVLPVVLLVSWCDGGERPRDGWRYSDRTYQKDRRTPSPLANSQNELWDLVRESGYSGKGGGYMQTVLALDGPREQEGRLLYWIARGDTLWRAPIPHAQCYDDECSFVGVVDGVAPDSTTIVFVDWSTLTLQNDGKGKRR